MKVRKKSRISKYGKRFSVCCFMFLIIFGCGNDGFKAALNKESGVFPPLPGNAGIVSASYAGNTIFDVRWQSASDDKTSSSKLQYRVFASNSVLSSYNQALEQADELTKGWSAGIVSLQVYVAPGSLYNWCNVYVQDEDGKISAYNGVTPTPYINTPPVAGGGGNLVVTSSLPLQAMIAWEKGSDLQTPQTSLQYRSFYSSAAATIDTYEHAAAATEITAGWVFDLASIQATLPAGGTFWFNVFVMDGDGLISAYTPKQTVVQAKTPPVVSHSLSFTSNYTSITVSWLKATDPDGETPQGLLQYRVFCSTSATALNSTDPPAIGASVWEVTSGWTTDWSGNNTLSATAGGLINGNTYYFNVYVRDLDLMIASYGATAFNTTTLVPPTLGNSGALNLIQNRDSVNIQWQAATSSSTPVSYRVYYSSSNNITTYDQAENLHNGIEITNGWAAGLATVNANALARNATWYFNVFVMGSDGGIAAYTPASINLPANAAPVPGTVNAPALTNFSATFSWMKATDDYTPREQLQYRIFYSTSSIALNGTTPPPVSTNVWEITLGWTTDISTALTPVLPRNTTYYYKIFVRDTDGLIAAYSTSNIVVPASILTQGIIQNLGHVGGGSSWNLAWTPAFDQVTPTSLLQYRVFSSTTSLTSSAYPPIPTGSGTLVEYTLGWTQNITNATFSIITASIPGHWYVFVQNADGNIVAYAEYVYVPSPLPGGNGLITTTTPTAAQQVDLAWTAAIDSNTPLQYCIYSSYVAIIGLDEAAAQAKILTYDTAVAAALSDPANVVLQEPWLTTLTSPTNIKNLGVSGKKYYFNIFVKNNSGVISAYIPAWGTTKP